MVAPRQATAAVAQSEQRVQLLHQLQGQPAPADGPDRDGVPGGRVGRDLEDRKRDVEPAADVDQAVVAPGQALVAGRAQLLDQPVLEHQRGQLRARHAVVDDRGVRRPVRRAASTGRSAPAPGCGSRPTCRRTGPGRRRRGTGTRRGHAGARRTRGRRARRAAARPRRAAAAAGPAPQAPARPAARSSASASATVDGVGAQPREQRAQHPRAGLGVGQRPVAPGGPRSPARRRARSGPARAAAGASPGPGRRCRCTGGLGHSSPIRANAWRSTRRSNGALWATITRPSQQLADRRQHRFQRRAPSTIAWVIPVKRWIPRRSGALVRTSELQRSCSSPPPTSTAPTSVSSQPSPPRPLVSVSTTMNSAVAIGAPADPLPRDTPGAGRRAGSLASTRTESARLQVAAT